MREAYLCSEAEASHGLWIKLAREAHGCATSQEWRIKLVREAHGCANAEASHGWRIKLLRKNDCSGILFTFVILMKLWR